MSDPSEPEGEPLLLWERPDPALRPAPTPLSREKILQAAMAIADREGLTAVSLRKVGAALHAGPMRLYGYLSTKEELLDLMIDAVFGEIVSMGPIGGDWRAVLRTIAQRTRWACQDHKWFIDLLGGRPHLGPNALAFLEASYAALNVLPGFDDIDVAMQTTSIVNAYAIGAIRGESSEFNTGMNEAEWRNAWWPYLERRIATGRYPMLAKIVRDASHPPPDVVFERGLDAVLAGIAALL